MKKEVLDIRTLITIMLICTSLWGQKWKPTNDISSDAQNLNFIASLTTNRSLGQEVCDEEISPNHTLLFKWYKCDILKKISSINFLFLGFTEWAIGELGIGFWFVSNLKFLKLYPKKLTQLKYWSPYKQFFRHRLSI